MSSADLHDIECQRASNLPCICRSLSSARLDTYLSERASLRAKVEALQAQPFAQVGASGWDSISRADVLALFDGASHD